jgi:DNA-binding MarR family transcriptional regulator
VPKTTDSLAEASRAMSVLIGREGRRELVARLVERAGVDLSPAAAWLIVRLQEADDAHPASIPQLCERFDIPLDVGQSAVRELDERGLLLRDPTAGEDRGRVVGVTPEGAAIAGRLVEERRASLARRCSGWAPEDNEELTGLLTRLARELSPDEAVPAGAPAAV